MMVTPRSLRGAATARCTLGCPVLDRFCAGGVPCGSITELTGEAAASKSQVCMQLLLTCQLPQEYGGLDGDAIYFYTEGDPAMSRLQELTSLLHLRVPAAALAALPDPTAHIFIERGVSTGLELLHRLERLRPLLEARRAGGRRVRLLVVDSIAGVFRELECGGVDELSGRTELLFRVAALLRLYADEFDLAVVVTNQIMDAVGGSEQRWSHPHAATVAAAGHSGGARLISSGREVVPALGLAWANCVNTRVFLAKAVLADGATPARYQGPPSAAAARAAELQSSGEGAAAPQLRSMRVVFSPFLAQGECAYVVEQTGVRGLLPEELACAQRPSSVAPLPGMPRMPLPAHP